MAMSAAERQQRLRDRRKAAEGELESVPALAVVPVVSPALEEWLPGLKDPNPALVAVTRALAASLDAASGPVHPALAAEYRRSIGALASDQARKQALKAPKRAASALDELRAARARSRKPA